MFRPGHAIARPFRTVCTIGAGSQRLRGHPIVNPVTPRQSQAADVSSLREPAHYYPFESGRYEVKTGLYGLGTDFGNGEAERRVFQLDRAWPAYRAAKLESRAEDLSKYVCEEGLPDSLGTRLVDWVIRHLPAEYPELFDGATGAHGTRTLHNRLSAETLVFDRGCRLLEVHAPRPLDPPYVSALDALACQIQEDMALVTVEPGGRDRLCYLHLCLPNHWAARDKIGKSFAAVHAPVPEMDRINRRIAPVLEALVERGPFVRFAWGLATDARLNHHPEPPAGVDEQAWHGRRFEQEQPALFVRIERQTTVGFPEHDAFLFTIRTYFEEVAALKDDHLAQLRDAIASMGTAALRYKGLEGDRDDVSAWLSGLQSR